MRYSFITSGSAGLHMPTKTKKIKIIYDFLMILLAIVTIVLLILESSKDLTKKQEIVLNILDTSILVVFIIDYFTRLIMSKNKWIYIKSNIPDLLSVIPFSQIFQALRVLRVFRLLKLVNLTRLGKAARLFSVFAKFSSRVSDFLRTNNFIYITYIAGGAVLFGTIGISYAENLSFGDALWWSIVTTTTVGYGDISPKTTLGKAIAVVLMIIGIGFLGMLTGTISTYFLSKIKKNPPIECSIDESISLAG
jgi:voltage-gated potassium channel